MPTKFQRASGPGAFDKFLELLPQSWVALGSDFLASMVYKCQLTLTNLTDVENFKLDEGEENDILVLNAARNAMKLSSFANSGIPVGVELVFHGYWSQVEAIGLGMLDGEGNSEINLLEYITIEYDPNSMLFSSSSIEFDEVATYVSIAQVHAVVDYGADVEFNFMSPPWHHVRFDGDGPNSTSKQMVATVAGAEIEGEVPEWDYMGLEGGMNVIQLNSANEGDSYALQYCQYNDEAESATLDGTLMIFKFAGNLFDQQGLTPTILYHDNYYPPGPK